MSDDAIPIDKLAEHLRNHRPGPVKPVPRYSERGDMVEVHWDPEPAFADRVTEQLTLLRAFSDRRVVGVKLYDVVGPEVRKATARLRAALSEISRLLDVDDGGPLVDQARGVADAALQEDSEA